MGKPARKWVIGFTAMLSYVAVVAFLDAISSDTVLPAVAIGLTAWALSLLRRSLALVLFGPPVLVFLLMASNSQGLARGVTMFFAVALGIALSAAIIGSWVFDRYLQQDRADA